jgi:peptidyl-dipeptidase Dcp
MSKQIAFLILSVFIVYSCQNSSDTTMKNPLLETYNTPYDVPPFDKIKPEHLKPAIIQAIIQHTGEIDAIVHNAAVPDFENTVAAMDKSGELLTKVTGVLYNLSNAHTNDELEKINEEMAPVLSAHYDKIYQNPALFSRIKQLYDSKATLNADNEQQMLLEKFYKNFVRNGALLSDAEKEQLSKINQELSVLTIKFGQNTLADVNEYKLIIEDKVALAGLPDELIYEASQKALKENMEGKWIFTLHNPSVLPFLQYADNRQLREKIWQAFSNKGNNGNNNDNNEIISKILSLRIQKARLLGYPSHAHYVLEEQMAKNPDNVSRLLNDLWKPAVKVAMKEAADLRDMMKSEIPDSKLMPYDWRYYAEKLRKQKYDLDEQELKPYFSLENTREGVFEVCRRLFGLGFKQRTDIPVYQEEVTAWEVSESNGNVIGILYMDFHPRESKRGGAWMTSFREQKYENGKRVIPIISIVCNFSKPTADAPALLTYDEVNTFFHEFGHALHGLLSDVKYTTLSGTNVPTDFVELPSQIMENWAAEPEVLKLFAKHYKTGEIIPDALITKIKNSGTYGQGFATAEYLAASILDMDFHTLTEIPETDIAAFEKNSMQKIGLPSEIIPRYRSTYFNHIFSGGYSSGYYSYIWSEVLDSDAFDAFKEKGLFDNATATSFRKNILERGGTGEPMQLYKNFRGKEPSITPLLKKRGLADVKI